MPIAAEYSGAFLQAKKWLMRHFQNCLKMNRLKNKLAQYIEINKILLKKMYIIVFYLF